MKKKSVLSTSLILLFFVITLNLIMGSVEVKAFSSTTIIYNESDFSSLISETAYNQMMDHLDANCSSNLTERVILFGFTRQFSSKSIVGYCLLPEIEYYANPTVNENSSPNVFDGFNFVRRDPSTDKYYTLYSGNSASYYASIDSSGKAFGFFSGTLGRLFGTSYSTPIPEGEVNYYDYINTISSNDTGVYLIPYFSSINIWRRTANTDLKASYDPHLVIDNRVIGYDQVLLGKPYLTEKKWTYSTSEIENFKLKFTLHDDEIFKYNFYVHDYSLNILPDLTMNTYCNGDLTISSNSTVEDLNNQDIRKFTLGCEAPVEVELTFATSLPNYEEPKTFEISFYSYNVNDTVTMTTTDQFGVPSVQLPPRVELDEPDYDSMEEFDLFKPSTWLPALVNGILNPIIQAFQWLVDQFKNLFVYLFIPDANLLAEEFNSTFDYVMGKFGFIVEFANFFSDFTSAAFETEFPDDYNPLPKITIEEWNIVDEPIIDLTWYNEYRDFIHGFIVFLAFFAFALKTYKRMPEIIGGGGK